MTARLATFLLSLWDVRVCLDLDHWTWSPDEQDPSVAEARPAYQLLMWTVQDSWRGYLPVLVNLDEVVKQLPGVTLLSVDLPPHDHEEEDDLRVY